MSKGMVSRSELMEQRRRLAVARVREGWSTKSVASFLDVTQRAVQSWVKAFRERGTQALAAQPRSGRPPKLTLQQEQTVLGWILHSPTEFGFATELWTAPRVTSLIRKNFGVTFNPHYVVEWLAKRNISSQRPQRQPREKNPQEIQRWLKRDWKQIAKKSKRSRSLS
jgi:transposase